jgi:cold shock CspA family protein
MTQETTKVRGTIRWFSNEGDHGFVRPDDGGQDIHVRREHTLGDRPKPLKRAIG